MQRNSELGNRYAPDCKLHEYLFSTIFLNPKPKFLSISSQINESPPLTGIELGPSAWPNHLAILTIGRD